MLALLIGLWGLDAATPGPGTPQILARHLRGLPAGVEARGHVVEGFRWRDSNGEFLAVVTETSQYPSPPSEECESGSGCKDKEIHGYGYRVDGDSLVAVWHVQDHVRNCFLDMVADLEKGAPWLSDLDSNGVAEFSFSYTLGCFGDMSERELKFIQMEGTSKRVLRGTNNPYGLKSDPQAGKMVIDPSFAAADRRQRRFAIQKFRQSQQPWPAWQQAVKPTVGS